LYDQGAYRDLGEQLQEIVDNKWNVQDCDRETYVRCPSGIVEGQNLFMVRIEFSEDNGTAKCYLVFNQKGEIIPCEYGEVFCPNWDKNSPEAMETLGIPNNGQGDYDDYDRLDVAEFYL